MIHTHSHTEGLFPTIRKNHTDLLLLAIMFVLIATAVWPMRTTSPPALVNNPIPRQLGTEGGSTVDNRIADLPNFEQKTQALVASDSNEAFQALLLSLKENEPLAQRSVVLAALQGASPAVVPVLMDALSDADPGVRAGAAEALGQRREYQAIAGLTQATRDSAAGVRLEAVKSLGTLDAWQVLPRLEQLWVSDASDDVRQAAAAAQENIRSNMALAIGVSTIQLRDISVTLTDLPQIYAVTSGDLYARHGTQWELVSRLPDAPLALATSAEPQLIYLATVSSGLYRSVDSGETWEHVQFGLETPTQLTVTAVVVDPQDSGQVYIALASRGAEPGVQDPLGISVSTDGGATWWGLEDSPMDVITTRLVIDPQRPGWLFGMTMDTPWSYAYTLPAPSTVSADPTNDGEASE